MAYKKKGKPQRVCRCGENFLGVGKYCYECQDLIYSSNLSVEEYKRTIDENNKRNEKSNASTLL